MAPAEGRFARPERRWDCRRGTPDATWTTFVRTMPAMREDEAKSGCNEAEAENSSLEITLASRT